MTTRREAAGTQAAGPGAGQPAREGVHFRHVMGHFPSGVSLVTGIADDGPAGLAVGSFMAVSLEPQMIAICPGLGSSSWPRVRSSGGFCVNILGEHQQELCRRFAISGGDKFAGLRWEPAPSGSPVIEDTIAWIDCELESEQKAGDHWLVLGTVLDMDVNSTRNPLLFHRGEFERLASSAPQSGV